MVGWVGDPLSAIALRLHGDADFAGCVATQRSTSGHHRQTQGPHTCWPLAGISKRQSCASHSTPEAEMVAASLALRQRGLPAMLLWDRIRSPIVPQLCLRTVEQPHAALPDPEGDPLRVREDN